MTSPLRSMAHACAVLAAALAVAQVAQTAQRAAAPAVTRPNARAFFESAVTPRLVENGCPLCHAVNYVEPAFGYEGYLPFIAMGRSAEDNYLVTKISGVDADGEPLHIGGRRCKTLDDEPCATLRHWWRLEFGDLR